MLLRTTHFLPREPAEQQFLLKSSRALARGVLLGRTQVRLRPLLSRRHETEFN
jgi:hypothetical protein